MTLNDKLFLLINIYTANTELEQIETLSDLEINLDKVKDIQNKNIRFGGEVTLLLHLILVLKT